LLQHSKHRASYVLETICSRACTRAPVHAQIGLFVADVTSVLAEEESEAAKRYSRSAMGKSFSRKRSTMLPVAQERHSRASSVKPKWRLYTSFLPTYKSYSRKSWFRAVVFLLHSYYRSFCFIDTAILWCFSLRHVLHTYIIWHCRKRVDSARKKPRYPQRFRQEYQGRATKATSTTARCCCGIFSWFWRRIQNRRLTYLLTIFPIKVCTGRAARGSGP